MSPFPQEWFRRDDETPDPEFYSLPRFVTHIDDRAIEAVTQLYREHLPPGGAILDVMSSWVSHLPPEVTYCRVTGLGINRQELAANPRLTDIVVHDLNRTPTLPFGDSEFEGGAICVSVDYLAQPVEVLRDLGRVLRKGAPLIITFSNRCFPMKVIAVWKHLDGRGRQKLVELFLQAAGNWRDIRALTPIDESSGGDPLYGVICRSAGP